MRKILALLLSAIIILAPVHSYAVLPLIATAASAAGRVLLANAVKKPIGVALKRKAMLPCVGSLQAAVSCAGLALSIADYARDKGYTIEQGDTINEGDININIYKIANCQPEFAFNWWSSKEQGIRPSSEYRSWSISEYNSRSDGINGGGNTTYSQTGLSSQPFNNYISEMTQKASRGELQIVYDWKSTASFYWQISSKHKYDSSPSLSDKYAYGFYKCADNGDDNRIYMSQSEINEIIDQHTTNLTVNDIKNMYNYDYSQHPNITINNNNTAGDTINNDFTNAPQDFTVSDDLANKINNNTVDMDNINDNTYDKNENGDYDKPKQDPDPDPDPDTPDPDPDTPDPDPDPDPEPDPDPDPEPEPPPIECDANGFYKKVCDWMDWTQKPHDKPDSGNVDIIDKSEGLNIDQNRIDFTNQCPAPTPINTSVGGFPVSTELNYQPLCDFFTMLNPFVIGMGGISSALIIAASGRRL